MSQEVVEQTTVVDAQNPTQPHNLHSDVEGQPCIKRLWGSVLTSIGTGMVIITFVFSLIYPDKDFSHATSIGIGLIWFGLGFYGLTIPEPFLKLFNRR